MQSSIAPPTITNLDRQSGPIRPEQAADAAWGLAYTAARRAGRPIAEALREAEAAARAVVAEQAAASAEPAA